MKLSRKEKWLFFAPLVPLATVALMQFRLTPTLSVEKIEVKEHARASIGGSKFVHIITKFETWSLSYRVQNLRGGMSHSGVIDGYFFDAQGKRLNPVHSVFTSNDPGDHRLYSNFLIYGAAARKPKGTVRFIGHLKYNGVQSLPLNIVI